LSQAIKDIYTNHNEDVTLNLGPTTEDESITYNLELEKNVTIGFPLNGLARVKSQAEYIIDSNSDLI